MEMVMLRLHVDVPLELLEFMNALDVQDIVRAWCGFKYSREDCCIGLKVERIEVVDDVGVTVKVE